MLYDSKYSSDQFGELGGYRFGDTRWIAHCQAYQVGATTAFFILFSPLAGYASGYRSTLSGTMFILLKVGTTAHVWHQRV
jgi:hypothetical protein